jgi:hypothetical protein
MNLTRRFNAGKAKPNFLLSAQQVTNFLFFEQTFRYGFAARVGFAATALPRRELARHLWALPLVRPLAH